MLKENGKIVIMDEVVPQPIKKKILYYLIRIPLKFVTYLFAQTTTKPLRGIEKKLSEAHFTIEFTSRHLFGSLQVIVATKEKAR